MMKLFQNCHKAAAVLAALLSVSAAFAQGIRSSQVISNNYITCMTEDRDGFIWIGTQNGLNRYNGIEFICYEDYGPVNGSQSMTSDYITTVAVDSRGRAWAGTKMGVNIIENTSIIHPEGLGLAPTVQITEFSENYMIVADNMAVYKVNISTLEKEKTYRKKIGCFVINENKEIWATTYENGRQIIQVLSPDLKPELNVEIPAGTRIKGCLRNNDGMIWFYSGDKLFSTNANDYSLIARDIPAIKGKHIQFVSHYKPGILLIGLTGTGMLTYNIWSEETSEIHHEERLKDKSSIALVDSNNSVWVSNSSNVVSIYNEKRYIIPIRRFLDDLSSENIESFTVDSEKYLWAVVGGELVSVNLNSSDVVSKLRDKNYSNLYLGRNGSLWMNENGSTLKKYATSAGKLAVCERTYEFDEPFTAIVEDFDGSIIVQFADKLGVVSTTGGIEYNELPEGRQYFKLIKCAGAEEIFITTDFGLYRINAKHQLTTLLTTFLDCPCNIAKDPLWGDYWIGTTGGLVRFDPEKNEVTRYGSSDGIPESPIAAVTVGPDNNIWIATETDIIRYQLNTATFSHYVDTRFSSPYQFRINCNAQSPSGMLMFAGTSGICAVNPASIPARYERNLELKSVKVGYDNFLTPEPNATFKHNQNMLNFWCSTSDPVEGYNIEYRYFLEGFDKGWSASVKNGWIFYEEIPAGEYVFHAMVRNNDGTWSKNTIDFPFRIKPHPLRTEFAMLIYFIMGIAVLIFLIWFFLHYKLKNERLKFSAQREVMAKQHIDYLTDMSHELKLPLTLIYAPVQELSKSTNLNQHETELLNLISHNVGRMKTLTEQMLDSGKYEEEKNNLKVALYNVVQLIKMIANNYRFIAMDRNISLSVSAPDSLQCWLDFEKVVKILNNLVSNAIKYTPEGGKVEIECKLLGSEGRLQISVTDNGIGIAEDKRQSIFDRFERLDIDDIEGSGVGLNFAQKLATLHKGNISYKPAEPKGSVFTLTIPAVEAAFNADEIINIDMQTVSSEAIPKNVSSGEVKDKSVLVAEDDYELMIYLETLFSGEWNVIGVNNGLEAMDNITQIVPDLIITDVSMPGMNGFDLCRNIKESETLSHVPVIMLTALGDVESSITGLDCGADAYITKPFDPYYLVAEAKALVKNRKRIQDKISNLTSTSIEEEDNVEDVVSLKEADKLFLKNLHTIIDRHLSEEGFNASFLAKEMNNSYSNFYIKLKALTGQGPQVYLNNYKMNVAMELLKSGQYNVGEVAFKTGFSAISNFSRSFKKRFGYSPSEVH